MKNSVYTKGSVKGRINNQFKNPPVKKTRKKKKTDGELPMKKRLFLLVVLLITLGVIIPKLFTISSDYLTSPQVSPAACIWDICSIDTMRTSRDRARAELHNAAYDSQIQTQLRLIKDTGAGYVAIDTPYDEEFLPYLKRWVKLAREERLSIWFRGNWSEWEGWFDYEKNMTPEDHLVKTAEFISTQKDLFQDGDIFDPCPECENAGYWPQPFKDKEYQSFVRAQQKNTEEAFKKIDKKVTVHQSIIGGRVKDVVSDQTTFDSFGKIVGIDHYVKTPEGMSSYIENFSNNFGSKTLVSEFGAPIPDMNGPMNDQKQAEFVGSILETLYKNRSNVKGLNYWSLSEGTTSIVDENNNPLPAYEVIKKYFSPGLVYGKIIDDFNEPIGNVEIKTGGQVLAKTNENGFYSFPLPPRKIELIVEAPGFEKATAIAEIKNSKDQTEKNFNLKPANPGILHQLKLWVIETF